MSCVYRYDHFYNTNELGLDSEQARRHRKLVDKIAGISLHKPDPILPMLITSLILYSPDFVDLDKPASAERQQIHFASLLHRYAVLIYIYIYRIYRYIPVCCKAISINRMQSIFHWLP